MLSRLRDSIVELVEGRDEIVASQNLDVAFCYPDGNWHRDSDNNYLIKYRKLRDCPIAGVQDIIHELSENYRGTTTEETYNDYISLLSEIKQKSIVLEIGAGYGLLASKFLVAFGSKYIICDIPESLLFSGLCLALHGHDVSLSMDSEVTLVPNYWFNKVGNVDLVINTLSMSEMSEYQVRVYAKGISKRIGLDGTFFEHNFDNRHCTWGKNDSRGIDCKTYIADYFACRTDVGNASFWSIGISR